MASNTDDEETFINSDKVVSIVNILTKYKIKLWEMSDLSLVESTASNDDLINKISDEAGLVETEIKNILIKLQKRSIVKLEENKRFNKDGVAKFKLKIIGNNNQKMPKSFTDLIDTQINVTGSEFKQLIMNKFELNCDNLKIICNGKVIKEDSFLSSQNITNHSTFMIMCVYEGPISEMSKTTADFKLISDIKDAVNILTDEKLKLDDINLSEFKIKNQNGVSLDISKHDTNHLASAMILHEKGKLLIKSKDYIKALILLAEADNEFKNCRDQSLLERVDNYALLNLDIIWCYLCLENLHELKNAEERLSTCEKCLERCYGASLERLNHLKSDEANKHIPIFVRLNLLKGILNYHKGKKNESKQALDKANKEMQRIIIDDEKLSLVMSMGFTNIEARLALRSTSNNVDAAIEQIFKKKQREKEAKKLELEKAVTKRIETTYGRTQNNKPVDIKIMNDLIQFGYTEKQAVIALIRGENDFNLALDLLQSSSLDNLDDGDDSNQAGSSNSLPDDDILNQLVSMGYDINLCKLSLNAFKNNIQKAIDFFCENRSNLVDTESLSNKLQTIIEKNESKFKISPEEREKAENAQKFIDSIKKDINQDDEAYLDLNLDEDEFFINKYYSLLSQ